MLNESIIQLSVGELRDVLLLELTVFHVALGYILIYVVYKALGRYIYFKPQEHASKINRTFLVLSLLIVLLHALNGLMIYLPFLSEYRWLYTLGGLVLLIAPLSIITHRIIWKYSHGGKQSRDWHYYFLPIPRDYYKTNISKSANKGNGHSEHWEEEGVESTNENIHSDALLNILALVVFVTVSWNWANNSVESYGWISFIFFAGISIPIAGIFSDRAIFSWIDYLAKRK